MIQSDPSLIDGPSRAQPIVAFSETHAPVFVVGMERGGTSIINRTLSTAPCFTAQLGGLETFIFDNPHSLFEPDVRGMTVEYLGGRDRLVSFRRWFDQITGWPENWMQPRKLVTAYFYYVWASGGSARILEKTPRHALKLAQMVRFFPKCRIVGIHRHPLGVVESYHSRLKREIELGRPRESYEWLDRTPHQICAHIEKIAVALDKGLKEFPQHLIVVSYEELLRDPAFVMEAVARFCQVDGVKVEVSDGSSASKNKGSDPLLASRGIVTANQFTSSLDRDEKLALFQEFPALFSIAAGLKRAY